MKEGKSEYKPCPFCGSEKIKEYSSGGLRFVACISCCARTSFFVTTDSAAEAWNRRANEQKPED